MKKTWSFFSLMKNTWRTVCGDAHIENQELDYDRPLITLAIVFSTGAHVLLFTRNTVVKRLRMCKRGNDLVSLSEPSFPTQVRNNYISQ